MDLDLCFAQDSQDSIWNKHFFLFLCHVSTQRPMNDRKVERSKGHCFGRQILLANSIENFILHEKKSDSSLPEIYKAFKPF